MALKFFLAEILKSQEIFIFSGTDGKGSQIQEILISAGNITGMAFLQLVTFQSNIKC
jgi:hypothetical protein